MNKDGRIVRIREDDAPAADPKAERYLRAGFEAADVTPAQFGEVTDRS